MTTKSGAFKTVRGRAHAMTVPRPPRTIVLVLATVLVAGRPPEVAGQSAPVPSVHVRIHRNDSDTTAEGQLVSMDEEGLVYRPVDGSDVRVNHESVDSVQLHVRHNRAGRGFAVGAVGGTVVLTALAAATCHGDAIIGCNAVTLIVAPMGALVGGLAGVIVGSFFKTESWELMAVPWSGKSKGLALGAHIALGHRPRRQSQ